MFQLLQPIWLWSISGIIIPVMIHLWNVREGKTVKVGSISLLQESARQHARSLKIKDLLLLLLRCLLIIVLAFLLAKPTWQEQLFSGSEKGWMLIEKGAVKDAYQQHKSKIDSLQKAGFKFHYFNEEFPAEDWQRALKQPTDTTRKTDVPYWTLLKKLNEHVPPDLPVFLFTTNDLKRFSGPQPAVAMNLKWFIYSLPDTIIKMPAVVHKTSTDSLRLVVLNSAGNATYYTFENVEEKNVNPAIKLDTSAIDIAIYTDNFATDALYLKAAIDAIEQTADIKINTLFVKGSKDLSNEIDWLFWLSEKPLPQVLPPNVFLYKKGKENPHTSFIYSGKINPLNSEPLNLSRNTFISSEADERPIWKDGYGNSLLAVSHDGKRNRYHFYSHFNPAWNDLPWSSNFVNMIYDLLIRKNISLHNLDKRMIDGRQIMPVLQARKDFAKQKFIQASDLSKVCWAIAFLLFFLERYISFARKNEMYG